MKVKVNRITNLITLLGIVLVFFSSACLWNSESLSNYIMCSLIVIPLVLISYALKPINIYSIVKNKYVIWVAFTYLWFELYGLVFLRAGTFNWDFILVSGVLQICITILLMQLESVENVVNIFCKGCVIATVIVCIYMIQKSEIRLSEISFGSSFGVELSGNRNTVATILGIMLIPVSFYALRTKRAQVLFVVIATISAGCMLLTGSKKGIIVVLLIVMMIFWLNRSILKYLMLPLMVVGGIYAIYNVPFLYNTVGYRVSDMLATLGFGTAVTAAQSTATRSKLISDGLRTMWNYPILGGGMNYFQHATGWRYYSHNNYIELLNNFGILGTALYYLPFVNKIPTLYKNTKDRNPKKREIYVFLCIFLLSKLMLDYAMVSYSTMCVFAMQFLVVFEILRREKIEKQKDNGDSSIAGIRRRGENSGVFNE